MKKTAAKRIIIILLICAAAFVMSEYFYQLAMISGDSMYPAYKNMQLVFVDKRSGGDGFAEGDVIGFMVDGIDGLVVKRVAAVPGNTVQIIHGQLLVDGKKSRAIQHVGKIEYAGIAEEEIRLGEGEYFVLGDNVSQSKDSRYENIGIVRETQIVGKILPSRIFG